MAEWQVVAAPIELFPHPNADSLQLGKVGHFQVVVGKDSEYVNGDLVFFAPERSVLPDEIKGEYCNAETGISYLGGPDNNRVKRVRLRGEFSEGVTLDPVWAKKKLWEAGLNTTDQIPLDADLSGYLNITKYEPPMPAQFAGQLGNIVVTRSRKNPDAPGDWATHDVEQFRLYAAKLFKVGEEVVVTEKVHGSQLMAYRASDGTRVVSSKGFTKRQIGIQDDPSNLYWMAVRAVNLFERLDAIAELEGANVQVFGEVIPCQGAKFTYGQTSPTLRVFRVVVDGVDQPFSTFAAYGLADITVPLLWYGPYDPDKIVALAEGKEQVSGKETGIREGVVLSPLIPRKSHERGFPLYLKVINSKFKDSDEFIS